MASRILSLREQRSELAVIEGMASALAVVAENYEFGDGGDSELQIQCEAALVYMIPDLARRISKLYQSAHETADSGNVVRMNR